MEIAEVMELSPMSSPPSSVLSSPLSSPGSTPSPPPEIMQFAARHHSIPYPSPPSSQQTSQSSSPTPDGMDSSATTDKDSQRPTKRRRISKERTTDHLDLRYGDVRPDQQAELDQVLGVLHKRQKIVVIAGAGISVSAGIPDFRSANGLFKSLKDEHKLKGSGKDLFDASVYRDDTSTSSFHEMVSSMSRLTRDAKPTAFHHMLATIASQDRLLRLYTQNVDSIDTSLEPLKTAVPLRKNENGKWPQTVQLHGGLDKMVCSKCHELSDFDADLFSGPVAPPCSRCEEVNDLRTNYQGKRSHGIGCLRPRMVLYNESNPDETAIGSVTSDDLRKRPDAVIVVGTTLKVPGVKRIVKEMCATVRNRRGGVAIWINTDLPPVAPEFRDCFDIIVQGTCDEVANRAAMRNWNDDGIIISDDVVQQAHACEGEVHVRSRSITHASAETEPSVRHYNRYFNPPTSTPRKPLTSPQDWTPLSSRHSSILPSIEPHSEGDTVDSSGLPTPTKSRKSSPVKKLPTLNDKLKGAQNGKPTGKLKKVGNSTKAEITKLKGSGIKSSKSSKSKISAISSASLGPRMNTLTTTFKQSKAGITAVHKAKKSFPSPAESPSKLRQVSNMSATEPMHPLSPQDSRNNTSPSKARPVFPGLQSENSSFQATKKRLSIASLMD